ncbi:MAG TPA: helix-turn-helix domain-containing protein [Propionicimonas sp.]|jgi:AcrR family transcriptional regulator
MTNPVKRQYDSTRRVQLAGETRELIARAAHDLFVTRGYGRTTIRDVAGAAGVAVETVYAKFGTKATLLRQAWFVTFRGDDSDIPLYDRPEMQAVLAIPDLAERTRAHAAFVAARNQRSAPLLHAIEGAAASEPAAAQMLAEFAERRLDVATRYAASAAATGQLAISEADARDILYATMDGALWMRLVVQRGWAPEHYTRWLADLWLNQFVHHQRQEPQAQTS